MVTKIRSKKIIRNSTGTETLIEIEDLVINFNCTRRGGGIKTNPIRKRIGLDRANYLDHTEVNRQPDQQAVSS